MALWVFHHPWDGIVTEDERNTQEERKRMKKARMRTDRMSRECVDNVPKVLSWGEMGSDTESVHDKEQIEEEKIFLKSFHRCLWDDDSWAHRLDTWLEGTHFFVSRFGGRVEWDLDWLDSCSSWREIANYQDVFEVP
jgi:hypothetical protein